MKRTLLVLLALALSLPGSLLLQPSAYAVTASDWQAGNIIGDSVFANKDAMTVAQIQTWLDARLANCDYYGTQPANRTGGIDYDGNGVITRAEYGRYKGNPAPFTCLNMYYETPKTTPGAGTPASNYGTSTIPAGAKSAAQLIYDAAQAYNISPKVLLVKLGTESGGPLTSDVWPYKVQYTYAMGAHCPDSGPNGAANCDANYAGFSLQMREAAKLLRWYLDNMTADWWAYKRPYATNNILWNVTETGCGGSTVYIQNKATAALYTYTPYQPNAAALSNLYGSGDGCSAYGNRNFWRVYSDWFGSTYDTIYNGVDYGAVFDPAYYLNQYSDLRTALGNNSALALWHFVTYGMKEGRQGSAEFNLTSYKNRYADLRTAFRANLAQYYLHYMRTGKSEGRVATGVQTPTPITSYGGVQYSSVYDYSSYLSNNSDLAKLFVDDDVGALIHFIKYGMKEGRISSTGFNLNSYRSLNPDLRLLYGSNYEQYYLHYIHYGKSEGRSSTGTGFVGTSSLGGVNYSSVYDYSFYTSSYSDLSSIFGPSKNDTAALSHFIAYGMQEGRQGSSAFNVQIYKNNYPDLRAAFGNNLKAYYLHYINYGKKEGRIAI